MCKRLWDDDVIEHHGEFFDFAPVAFQPKPVQRPHPPLLIGGESDAALRRAARIADGWIGMAHTLQSAKRPIARLHELREEHGRAGEPLEICLGGPVTSRDDVERWEDAGVTRMIVSPWRRSREAIDGMRRFADLVELPR